MTSSETVSITLNLPGAAGRSACIAIMCGVRRWNSCASASPEAFDQDHDVLVVLMPMILEEYAARLIAC